MSCCQHRSVKDENGLTLIELLISIALCIILSGVIFLFVYDINKTDESISDNFNISRNVINAMDDLTHNITNANSLSVHDIPSTDPVMTGSVTFTVMDTDYTYSYDSTGRTLSKRIGSGENKIIASDIKLFQCSITDKTVVINIKSGLNNDNFALSRTVQLRQ